MVRPALTIYNNALKWSTFLVVFFSTVLVAILLWAANKGLDVSDESFYLLNFRYPDAYHASFSTFHLLIDFFTFHHELTVPGYRVMYLLSIIVQTFFFTFGYCKWVGFRNNMPLRSEPEGQLEVRTSHAFFYFLVAGLLSFSILPRTMSYNSLNSLTIYASAGLVLYALTLPSASKVRFLSLIGVGMLLSIGFFAKVSSAVICLGIHVLLLFALRRGKIIHYVTHTIGAIVLGIVIACTTYFVFIQPYGDWVFNFTREMKIIVKTSYGMGSMVRRYVSNVIEALPFLCAAGLPFFVACLLMAFQLRNDNKHRLFVWLAITVLLLLFGGVLIYFKAFDNGYHSKEATVKVLLVLVVGAVLFCGYGVGFKALWSRLDKAFIAVVLWLFVLPAVAAYGTSNSLFLNMIIDITSWFAILLLVTNESISTALRDNAHGEQQEIGRNFQRRYIGWAILLLVLPVAYAFQQTAWGIVFRPYMLTEDLFAQKVKVVMPGIEGDFSIDAKSEKFLTNARLLLSRSGYVPGDKIIVLHDMPGLVYFLGGISPNVPWYFSFSPPRNLHALDLNRSSIKNSYLILNKSFLPDELKDLRLHGLDFPTSYSLIGTLNNPYLGANPTQTIVKIYKYHE